MLDRWRAWVPSPAAVHRAFVAALVCNVGIVVTGGAVRLTASGLGCPTFPRCTDSSLVPTREMGVHGLVEFSNRMLTFALSAVVVAAVVVAWRAGRRDLRVLSGLLFAGIVAQALLGGITVLTGLNPVTVMSHFLLSMVLIAVATLAAERSAGQPVPRRVLVAPALLLAGRVLVGVTALLLVAGTVVTGTGPHSGDKHATHRLPFSLVEVTQLHADLVWLLVGLTVGLGLALRATAAPPSVRRRAGELLVVVLAQGLVGYLQYATNLPVGLVAVHVLGACLVWVAALRLALGMTERVRPVGAGPDGSRESLAAPAATA
jgi:cytochrome c oxidase assembly protein subunit 15